MPSCPCRRISLPNLKLPCSMSLDINRKNLVCLPHQKAYPWILLRSLLPFCLVDVLNTPAKITSGHNCRNIAINIQLYRKIAIYTSGKISIAINIAYKLQFVPLMLVFIAIFIYNFLNHSYMPFKVSEMSAE